MVLNILYFQSNNLQFPHYKFQFVTCSLNYIGLLALKGRDSLQFLMKYHPQSALHISVTRPLRFLWCLETDLSLSNESSKDDYLSLYINPIQDGGRRAKKLFYQLLPCNFYKRETYTQKLFEF